MGSLDKCIVMVFNASFFWTKKFENQFTFGEALVEYGQCPHPPTGYTQKGHNSLAKDIGKEHLQTFGTRVISSDMNQAIVL